MRRCEIDVPCWESPDYKPRKHKSTVDIMGVSRIVEKAIVNMKLGVSNGSGYAFDTDTRDVGFINGEKFDKGKVEEVVYNHTHKLHLKTRIKYHDDAFCIYFWEPDE